MEPKKPDSGMREILEALVTIGLLIGLFYGLKSYLQGLQNIDNSIGNETLSLVIHTQVAATWVIAAFCSFAILVVVGGWYLRLLSLVKRLGEEKENQG